MPRPTTAQVAYGSLTVVLTTVALLLATDARSAAAVAGLAAAGLLAGVIVAVALMPRGRRLETAVPAAGRPAAPVSVPRARVAAAEPRMTEHSLRR
ncbi:hypothetical protein [Actinacidiphila acidipaludis]|uniref:Secreted protein n=1 Tax=Actinacidiphila acidipaludis TaxID=2873382 RepID=A0ABS7Q806_9ACTN|nr:hypothetical protein [Streptomyces acidipaludis]MBY8879278.1 hypothetical protein [Streptomyces acidipaludis]